MWEEGDNEDREGESSSAGEGFSVKLERATAFHYDKVRLCCGSMCPLSVLRNWNDEFHFLQS